MKFFVDSVDPSEIRACAEQGIIHGVSLGTSPRSPDGSALIRQVCEIFEGPVVTALDGERVDVCEDRSEGGPLLERARRLARIAPNVVVRLPFSDGGLKAVVALGAEGLKAHVTDCRSAAQALEAARAGAAYVSPGTDRPGNIADFDLVRKIVALFKTYDMAAEVLVTSIRNANDVLEVALVGAPIATLPFPLLRQIVGQRR